MLAELGCDDVITAATIEQALARIDEHVFDAAMLDLNLDGVKSHRVAAVLAARGVPFFFSTGYTGLDMRDGHRDRPLLKKPFRHDELAGILRSLLAS
jgi:CheY-like chemotaxis protein